jgi:hypothetical protein
MHQAGISTTLFVIISLSCALTLSRFGSSGVSSQNLTALNMS